MKYKFREDVILEEISKYIDRTYTEHYAKNGSSKDIQTFELIAADPLRGLHFSTGSILKYADRAEYKNQTRKDLLKIIHYGVLALYCYDATNDQSSENKGNIS